MTSTLMILQLLIIGCRIVGARPAAHEVHKRALTKAEVLGDLTAGATGILNEDSKSYRLLAI